MGNSTEVMNFERALSLLKEGKKLTRYFEHKYVLLDKRVFRDEKLRLWRPTTADLLAEDWRVYA